MKMSPMSKERLLTLLRQFMTDPGPDAAEAYKFDIKMRNVRLPEAMEKKLLAHQCRWLVERTLREALEIFMEQKMQDFKWISGWTQDGRQGGWLVLKTDEPALTEYGSLPPDKAQGPKDWSPLSFSHAIKRLHDLQIIDSEVKIAKNMLLDDMRTQKFWGADKYWDRS